MTELAIEVNTLRKSFGDVEAVRGVSFDVAPGEVFGFLGPNGAGKTTTVRMLAALIAPSEGSAVVAGHRLGTDDAALRRSVDTASSATSSRAAAPSPNRSAWTGTPR